MSINEQVSTGFGGFDSVIGHLRSGDNVVWQADCVSDYAGMTDAYIQQAVKDSRRVVYFRSETKGMEVLSDIVTQTLIFRYL